MSNWQQLLQSEAVCIMYRRPGAGSVREDGT